MPREIGAPREEALFAQSVSLPGASSSAGLRSPLAGGWRAGAGAQESKFSVRVHPSGHPRGHRRPSGPRALPPAPVPRDEKGLLPSPLCGPAVATAQHQPPSLHPYRSPSNTFPSSNFRPHVGRLSLSKPSSRFGCWHHNHIIQFPSIVSNCGPCIQA